MSNIDKKALTEESARESGNILLIVAARMARRELFTPLHYVSELPQKVVSMRVFREALERSEETLKREVCKIVDGHDRMRKKLKEAEAKLEAAEKRLNEILTPNMLLPVIDDMDADNLRQVIKTASENYSLLHAKWEAAENRAEAAEKRIAELERKEQHSERQSVIDALASSGEAWSDIEEYMQEWDAARAAAAGKGE